MPADHSFKRNLISLSEDASDYGVFNRVITQGEGTGNYNAALHYKSGGSLISGAYKLNNLYNGDDDDTQSQNVVDAIIEKVFDTNPRTPSTSSSVHDYGVIYGTRGDEVHWWTLADEPLFWFDIGKNTFTGNAWTIDQVDIYSLSPFTKTENVVKQSLSIEYLTEEDYTTLTGHTPPSEPKVQEATIRANMLTLKDSYAWKPWIDETQTEEGKTTINEDDLLTIKGERPRFFRVVCRQPWFRYRGTSIDSYSYVRIILTGIKLYVSRKIVQSAELGVDVGFDSDEYKEFRRRIRRRTTVLEQNLALDSTVKAKQFAQNELRELSTDFVPSTSAVQDSNAILYDTVEVQDPQTGEVKSYLVAAEQRGIVSGKVQYSIVDFRTLDGNGVED